MKYVLESHNRDLGVFERTVVEIPGYDGDPYGDTVPFAVGSNQTIEEFDEGNPHHALVDGRLSEAYCLRTELWDAKANTAALAALEAATTVLGEAPYTGGCPAFWTPEGFNDLGWENSCPSGYDLVLMFDGGEFADLLNLLHEQPKQMNELHTEMTSRGYVFHEIGRAHV